MEPPKTTLSFRWRIGLWSLAWLLAATAMAIPNPRLLNDAWFFPEGLLMFIPGLGSNSYSLFIGWGFYAALTIIALRLKQRIGYFILLAILCFLLAANVASCHMAMGTGRG